MRYQLPAGQTGINIGGEQFNADKDGIITCPDNGDYVLLLRGAGCHPVEEKPATPAKATSPAK